MSAFVPCPNHGKCGVATHDPSLGEYAKCAQAAAFAASGAKVPAMALAVSPMQGGVAADIAETPSTYTYTLTPAEAAATAEKIAKINERAQKRGFTGRLTAELGPVETSTYVDENGFTRTNSTQVVTLGGEAPSYEGWTFSATLDEDPNAGLVVRTAPGVEKVDREAIRPGYCEHCGVQRHRKSTYLVTNDDTGEQTQVGSTCIKDFLGWNGKPTFLSLDEVDDELRGGFSDGPPSEVPIDDALAVAWAATELHGFVKTSSEDRQPTATRVGSFFFGRSKQDAQARAELAGKAQESAAKAQENKHFLLSDKFDGDSEYVWNMKSILGAESGHASARNIGILASAPQAWARATGLAAERALEKERRDAERAARPNAWIGAEGDKVELSGRITDIRYIPGDYGTTTLYTIDTDQGTVKWFASRDAFGEDTGVDIKFKATVKKHEEYQDHKSTVITRAKAI